MEDVRLKSFEPVVDKTTRIVILGSMPGVESLRRHQYYGHPRNQFWKIIYMLFDTPYEEDYNRRIVFLTGKGMGLWDVIESCERQGSLDADIKNEKVNDFSWLFKSYPGIKYVLFDGAKAYETFRKKIGFNIADDIYFKKLPSTSPANAIPLEKKFEEWQVIREYLKQEG